VTTTIAQLVLTPPPSLMEEMDGMDSESADSHAIIESVVEEPEDACQDDSAPIRVPCGCTCGCSGLDKDYALEDLTECEVCLEKVCVKCFTVNDCCHVCDFLEEHAEGPSDGPSAQPSSAASRIPCLCLCICCHVRYDLSEFENCGNCGNRVCSVCWKKGSNCCHICEVVRRPIKVVHHTAGMHFSGVPPSDRSTARLYIGDGSEFEFLASEKGKGKSLQYRGGVPLEQPPAVKVSQATQKKPNNRGSTQKELDKQGMTPASGSGTCRSPFAHIVTGGLLAVAASVCMLCSKDALSAAWGVVASMLVAPVKARAIRFFTETVKPKCFVCLVKCCGISATVSGVTTTLVQEEGTQMTPPPSDLDDDSSSSFSYDEDPYEAEPAPAVLMALSSSDSSASVAGVLVLTRTPGHHCPSCHRSWRAGDPNIPEQGICDRTGCAGQELQDGMLGTSRPPSQEVDLSIDCLCLVCGSDFAPYARQCRRCGAERGAALPEETLPVQAATLDLSPDCKHCRTPYEPNALNCRTCGELRAEGLTHELLLLAHIARKDFCHPDVIEANREQIKLLQTFLQRRFRVWRKLRNRVQEEEWHVRASMRARRSRARPKSQGERDAVGESTSAGSGACRTPNAHTWMWMCFAALLPVPTEAMAGPAQLAMYVSPFGVTTLAAVFHLCWVGSVYKRSAELVDTSGDRLDDFTHTMAMEAQVVAGEVSEVAQNAAHLSSDVLEWGALWLKLICAAKALQILSQFRYSNG
jgi:hypothetical protein